MAGTLQSDATPRELVVRVDANTRIGTGHFMRGFALAQAWRASGGNATFLGCADSDALRRRVQSAGIGFHLLDQPHPHPSDLGATLQLLQTLNSRQHQPPWLLLDGYHFDPGYHKAIRAAGYRLLVVDDMVHLPHYHADVLLNQNINAEQLEYSCDQETLLLLGARYALLRAEFLRWQGWRREIPQVTLKLLVTLGGSDPDNATLKVLQALPAVRVEGLETKVVVGAYNPHLPQLQTVAGECRASVELVQNADDMAGLMAWADVAVTGGGSTCWELAFMGVPAAVLVLAENQRGGAAGLDQAGAAINLGWHTGITASEIAERLQGLCQDYRLRRELSDQGRSLVDGRGTQRILEVLAGLDDPQGGQLQIRPAAAEDVAQIWRLANDLGVRQNSFNPEPIPWEHHVAWYGGKLASTHCRMWVMELGGAIVGQIRYDRTEPGCAEIGFSVAAAFRGRGLGTRMLTATCQVACRELGTLWVRGTVFKENAPSARAFVKAGFVQAGVIERQGRSWYLFELQRT